MNELEQRVQALEQELQILKNQIQSILLNIQEQVLSNTYPGLRAGDSSAQAAPVAPTPRSRPEPEEATRPTPLVRKVSFEELNERQDEEEYQGYEDEPQMVEAAPQKSRSRKSKINTNQSVNHVNHNVSQDEDHWQVMADLEEWAKNKIDTLGVQETADLIRTYTIKGRFTPQQRDMLIDFVVLHVNTHPDAPTQQHRSNGPFEVTARPPKNARARAISAPPAQRPARQQPMPEFSNFNEAQNQPAKEQPVTTAPTQKKSRKAEKPNDDKGSVVLRLIAGVQNAGAGVRWGKNDG